MAGSEVAAAIFFAPIIAAWWAAWAWLIHKMWREQ